MSRSVYEVQRDFALNSGLCSEIIWDALAADQADVLQEKIANLITGQTNAAARQRQQIFQNVWQQRKYTNRMLLSAIIYVLVTEEAEPEMVMSATTYSCHAVIRTRKCVREEGENSENCCMMFIDELGRVYANWKEYVYHNTLPKGTMVAPSQGIYRFTNDEDCGVHLMLHATPASQARHKILKAGDTLAAMGSLAVCVPVAVTLSVPVAPSMVMGAMLVTVSAAAYSTIRSISYLHERKKYGQPTTLRDPEARNSWLGVAGGIVGLGATGAAKVLSIAGRETNVAAQLTVKGIHVSSIVISGTGVANGIYDMYLNISDDKPLSSIDVLQIASSLLLFTHSINNLRLAKKAANGSSLRDEVRNQTRKIFCRIAEESAKLHSDAGGKKFDIVRTLNDIPIRETLLTLHEIYKHLAEGAIAVGTSLLPNLVSQDVSGKMRLNVELLATKFGPKFVQHISNMGSLMDVMHTLAKYFSDQAIQFLLQLTRSFLERNVEGIEIALNTFLSTETVLYRILIECIKNYKDFTVEYLEQRQDEISTIVSNYFQSLEPVSSDSRKFDCPDCHGVYYVSDL